MAGHVEAVGGTFLDYPGSLEYFSEPDTNDGVACVPQAGLTSNVGLVPLTGADLVESFDFRFRFVGTPNAYTGTEQASPYFPYNIIQSLSVPYQSSSLSMGAMDGHLWWLTQLMNKNNKSNPVPYIQQVPLATTGYAAQANLVSAANYAWAPSVQKVFEFNIKVSPALYFDRFYDISADGKMLRYNEVFVSPLIMSSTGRNIIPRLLLNPLNGATQDIAPGTQTGVLTTPFAWADNGSLLWIRRNGWRQPVNAQNMPPLFNWAHQWFTQRNVFGGASKVTIPIPTEGQLLRVVCRMFDPTLNAGIGGPIPLANAPSVGMPFKITYGSGLNKRADTAKSMQDRVFRQLGVQPTEGVIIWDFMSDTLSNLDAINTYNTASPIITLDFTGATPGAGSYVDTAFEFLTLVGS